MNSNYREIISKLISRLQEAIDARPMPCDECGIKQPLSIWVVDDEGMTSTDFLCAECSTTHILDGRINL